MNQDNINKITPINNTNDNIIPINNNISTPNIPKSNDNSFVSSLPNWDLVPPYQVVRRVIR